MKRKKGLYRANKEAKVGETITCPVCHTRFRKKTVGSGILLRTMQRQILEYTVQRPPPLRRYT